jgi:DNA polymerase-3 subunit delta
MASIGERALHAALKSRTFDPVYVLFGDDEFRKDAAVHDLVDAAVDPSTRDFNLEMRRGADLAPETLDALLGTPPMMADRRVMVIRDVDKLKKDARAVLERYLERPANDLMLLLVAPASAKLEKGLTSRSTPIEFAPLTGDRLPRWVAYHAEHVLGRTITPEATALLIEAAGPELTQLALELEKLASYAPETIDEHAVSEVVGVRRGESLGDLLDAVAAREAARALALLPGVLQQPKTTAVSIVMNLTTQTLALAYGVAARDRGTPARALFNEFMSLLRDTGAFPGRPWGEAVNAWTKHTDRWSAEELDAALEALLTTDAALKETRLSSPEQLLATLVLRLCNAGPSRRAA